MADARQVEWADAAAEALLRIVSDPYIELSGAERDAIALVRWICVEIGEGDRG